MGSIGESDFARKNQHLDYDVLIIGAGLSGIYSIYQMRQLGLRAKVLEAGSDVGGTWYWNRYPGARFDSESYSYNFFFSKELLEEWEWTEHFSPQPETLKYIEFVCKKFDLKRDMQFDTRIKSAHWQQPQNHWVLTDENRTQYTSRYIITAMGILNAFTLPDIPGVHDFLGESFHTARWPSNVSLAGKRVAVLGTGATGIQTIQEVAKTAGHLTVLQRTPNWSAPLNNAAITREEMTTIRAKYPEYHQRCLESYACFIHMPNSQKLLDATPEERETLWEHLYTTRGFEKWLCNYADIGTNREANELVSEFFAKKIRQRVKDPATAELLIPKCHGFGTKRVPLETKYFEVFNQENVRLKDIKSDPIQKVTATGIKTRDEEMEFDVIVYATGFDAVTGAFTAVDFRGVDGVQLADKWAEGPRTFLGLFVESFPNMTMIMGPHQMFGNIPRSIEAAVGWVANFLEYCRDRCITYAECTGKSVEAWTEHVHQCAVGLLANEVDSWMTGVNKNLGHKQKRIIARYQGPAPGYRKRAKEVADSGYQGLTLASTA
jgi:cation diffusion facilitator CzcD-associated flavoprotein CzcO